MRLRVDRVAETKNSTLGNFFINNIRQCYTLEDDYDEIKVPGETRIPAGTYTVELRHGGGFYERYSEKFGEDHPVLWIKNVPGYEYILIHIGNYYKDTAGCILVGKPYGTDKDGDYYLIDSTKAYKRIYYPIRTALAIGEEVTIEIADTVVIKPRKRTLPVGEQEFVEEVPPKKGIPWYKFYKKNGFKRIASFTAGIGGFILTMNPETAFIGKIVTYAAGSGLVVGVGDALKKNREKDGETYVDNNKFLRIIADIIIRLLKQFLNKKGK